MLLWIAADSTRDCDNGLEMLEGQIVSMLCLKVAISDSLTLLSARTQEVL